MDRLPIYRKMPTHRQSSHAWGQDLYMGRLPTGGKSAIHWKTPHTREDFLCMEDSLPLISSLHIRAPTHLTTPNLPTPTLPATHFHKDTTEDGSPGVYRVRYATSPLAPRVRCEAAKTGGSCLTLSSRGMEGMPQISTPPNPSNKSSHNFKANPKLPLNILSALGDYPH